MPADLRLYHVKARHHGSARRVPVHATSPEHAAIVAWTSDTGIRAGDTVSVWPGNDYDARRDVVVRPRYHRDAFSGEGVCHLCGAKGAEHTGGNVWTCRKCLAKENPSLILVTGANPPPPVEIERAWCRFHQRDAYDGKTVNFGNVPGAPEFVFALGRCRDIDFGEGPQRFTPAPWLVCSPDDNSLWIVAPQPMRLGTGVAGAEVHAVTYDPTAESGKTPAYYRHEFDEPRPVMTPVGRVGGRAVCKAVLLDGGTYRVTDWIHA